MYCVVGAVWQSPNYGAVGEGRVSLAVTSARVGHCAVGEGRVSLVVTSARVGCIHDSPATSAFAVTGEETVMHGRVQRPTCVARGWTDAHATANAIAASCMPLSRMKRARGARGT